MLPRPRMNDASLLRYKHGVVMPWTAGRGANVLVVASLERTGPFAS